MTTRRPSGGAPALPASLLTPTGWFAVLAIACIWFLTLSFRHLLPSDEGRYAEIAREMVASGDWVTIRYEGLKYFEKPPLHFWATALSFTVFGVGDWQARLWIGFCGALGIVLSMGAALRWYGRRVALFTGCALLATPAWVAAGHVNSLDTGVAMALTAVLSCLLVGFHPEATRHERRGWLWGAWLSMGVAVLAKGLIGIVLPGLSLIVYSLVARDWRLWRHLHLLSGASLMLIVVLPWFLLVSVRNPEFPQFFFIHEHWQRYTSGIHHRSGAWWYFVPQLLIGFLPWLGLSPRIWALVRDEPHDAALRPALFLVVWAATIFVFFSLSGSKLPGYIVPLYPALAILAGRALGGIDRRSWSRQILALLLLAVAGLCATPYIATLGDDAETMAGFRAFVPWLAAGLALAIAALIVAYSVNRRDTGRSIVAVSLAFFGLLSIAVLGDESFGRYSSGAAMARDASRAIGADVPLYAVRLLDHTVPFYMRHTTIPVEWRDELDFGIRQEPTRWLPTVDDFKRRWASPDHAGALLSHESYDQLRQEGVVMFPVAQDTRRVVVTNFAPPFGTLGPPSSILPPVVP